MKELVQSIDDDMSVEERNALSIAYRYVVGSKRASWRNISAIRDKKRDEKYEECVAEYRAVIEKELSDVCMSLLTLLNDTIIPRATTVYSKVFFHKMAGDYWRYMAEFATNDLKNRESSLKSYECAVELAKGLPPTDANKLGLHLNYSVFYYEIMMEPEHACKLAKNAFDEAISELDSLSEESYRESTMIMQILRDNISLWTSDMVENGDEEEEEEDDENSQ